MAVPGFLFAVTRPFHPDLTDAKWGKWYNNYHIVDVVDSGLAKIGVRYRNMNPAARMTYLAAYQLPDLSNLYNPEILGRQNTDSPLSPGSGYMPDTAEAELQGYQIMQKYDRPTPKDGTAASVLVSVQLEPAEGDDKAFEEWHKKALADPLYRRTWRYKSADVMVPITVDGENTFTKATDVRPKYLVLHEYDQFPYGKQSPADPIDWSKRHFQNAKTTSYDVWEYVTEYSGPRPEYSGPHRQ